MRYLYGDSTESDLQINYLAFLRQVIDCAVLLMKHKVGRQAAVERRRLKDQEIAAAITSIEDLGVQIAQSYQPIANDTTPIGRVMTSLIEASIEAIERESQTLRAAARAEHDREIQDDRGDRMRCIAALEGLLCVHDLPGAELSRDVVWRDTPRAHLNARARYATAVLTLEIPASSILAGELRVDKLVDGLEVHALEEGGWIKKNQKLVPHKIGRYVVTRIVVTRQATAIRMRAETGGGIDVEIARSGEIKVDRVGDNGLREPTIDAKHRPGFKQLAEKLDAAVNGLDKRTQLTSLEIDGVSILDHHQPHVLAERLIEMIAPVVQTIAKHSRNPEELVLRRLLGDDRREEIFVTVKELAAKLEPLPPDARQVFAPLGFVKPEPMAAPLVAEASARVDASAQAPVSASAAEAIAAGPVASPVANAPAVVEAKASEAKAAEAKAAEAKAAEAKAAEAKAAEAKAAEANAAEANAAEAKAAEANAAEAKAVEAKAAEAKVAEAVAEEAKAAEARAARAKAAEARLLTGIETRLGDAIDARLGDERVANDKPGSSDKPVSAAPPTTPPAAPDAGASAKPVAVKDTKSGPVRALGGKPGVLPVITVPNIASKLPKPDAAAKPNDVAGKSPAEPPRVPPLPPRIPVPLPARAHGATIEVDDAVEILDVTPEPINATSDSTKRHAGLLPRAARESEDVGAAVEAALDAISQTAAADPSAPAPAPAAPVAPAEATTAATTTTAAEPAVDSPASTEAQATALAAAATDAQPPALATETLPALTTPASTMIAELLKSERKPLPRALIVETGEYQPLPKPEASGS